MRFFSYMESPKRPKERQEGIIVVRVRDDDGKEATGYERAVYHDGWWWVDGIAANAYQWRPLTIWERLKRKERK